MKKTAFMISVMFALSALTPLTASAVIEFGEDMVGNDAYWALEDGVLTISGTGIVFAMHYPDKWNSCPWGERREEISKVVVEEGITSLGQYLFAGLPNLETVSLPDSLEFVMEYCFYECPQLSEINIPENAYLAAHLFDGDPLVFPDTDFQILNETYLYAYVGEGQRVVDVPDGIRTLGVSCFASHSEIGTVTLPVTLETISGMAFQDCTGLVNITLPNTLKSMNGSVFQGCTSLRSIRIPKSVTNIESSSEFQGCTSLESVEFAGSGLGRIGAWCFQGCEKLKELTIPDSVISIETNAFAGCTALETISVPKAVTYLANGAFSGCKSLKKAELPDALQKIQAKAFANCTALESVTLPDTVQFIAADAFSGCDAFVQAQTVQGAFIIGNVLLQYLSNDPVSMIPEGVAAIMNNAYEGSGVIEVHCPESLRYIRESAFAKCGLLTEFHLNENCELISANAFSQCSRLNLLYVPASVTEIAEQKQCSITDLYGSPDTAAEQFAKSNGIRFHDPAELENLHTYSGRDMTLDYKKDGWYFGNSRKVFGDAYTLNNIDRQYLEEHGISTEQNKTWGGSCVGLSITVILAKNGVFIPSQLQFGTKTLSDLEPEQDVVSFINFYQSTQGMSGTSVAHELTNLKIYRMLNIAENIPNGESPFLLTFATKNGSHGVVGYGQESGQWTIGEKTYDGRILVWDSNYPDALHSESCLYYDSLSYEYCIPQYSVHVTKDTDESTAGIITVCNDLSELNAYSYPFSLHYKKGDLNCDGTVSIADVVLLSRHLTTQSLMSDSQAQLADLSGDNRINAADLTMLKRRLLS